MNRDAVETPDNAIAFSLPDGVIRSQTTFPIPCRLRPLFKAKSVVPQLGPLTGLVIANLFALEEIVLVAILELELSARPVPFMDAFTVSVPKPFFIGQATIWIPSGGEPMPLPALIMSFPIQLLIRSLDQIAGERRART